MQKKISFIMPIYNEDYTLVCKSIDKIKKVLLCTKLPFEIIIGDDGSDNETPKLLKSRRDVRVVENKKRSPHYNGRGETLMLCFSKAKGDFLFYEDIDLAIDPSAIHLALQYLGPYDVVVGSKHLKGSIVKYPFFRKIMSFGYSFMCRLLLDYKIHDYQCGFKSFKKQSIELLRPFIRNKGWSWDTEILAKSSWVGLKIKEVPVIVDNMGATTVNAIRDIKTMGFELSKIYSEKKEFK